MSLLFPAYDWQNPRIITIVVKNCSNTGCFKAIVSKHQIPNLLWPIQMLQFSKVRGKLVNPFKYFTGTIMV